MTPGRLEREREYRFPGDEFGRLECVECSGECHQVTSGGGNTTAFSVIELFNLGVSQCCSFFGGTVDERQLIFFYLTPLFFGEIDRFRVVTCDNVKCLL